MIAGVPHVAMKPICENIGLDWDAQRQKINRHPILSKGKVMITAPSNGGLQEMLMLPIKMLNGWLFGIDSSRVKESIKDVVISYQEECFDVLAEHFMSKTKTTALVEPPTITKAQEGILFNKVKDISGGSGKIRAELWSRFQNHYNLSSYKNLPANQYEDAVQYLEAKQKEYLGHGVEMFYISSKEIEERAKSLVGESLILLKDFFGLLLKKSAKPT